MLVHKMKEYFECAAVVGTHGVRGTVRLENRCDSPAVLASLKTMYNLKNGEYIPLDVISASVQKNMVLCHFKGCDSVEDAVKMRGNVMYAKRDDIPAPEGAFFIADLIGLTIRDYDSEQILGSLKDVIKGSAQDIYVIESESGEFMIPAVKEFVKKISFGNECDEGIYVSLIEGMAP